MDDLTRLSYWFPLLEKAGLPVPKTEIIHASDEEVSGIWKSFEKTEFDPAIFPLVERIKEGADKIGYPCFLRTDHFSGKHNWDRCCFLKSPDDIANQVKEIAYFWECVNMFAPKCDVWVVREFLPTIPVGVCTGYGNMPICKEFRFFVEDGEIICFHPYWPQKAFEQGDAVFDAGRDFSYERFCTAYNEDELRELAMAAGRACPGKWSIDLLETERGWFITDMAEAHKSFHWEGCENA
jgi:hypothetical protein